MSYIVANQQADSTSDSKDGSNSNLYDDDELSTVRDVQRRLSLVAFEERENKLQRAEEKIMSSKTAKRAGAAKSIRAEVKKELKKEILANPGDEVDKMVDESNRERFEKALISGKAASKDGKPSGMSTRHAITTQVLGTQASGVAQGALGEDMRSKMNRVANVAAKGNTQKHSLAPVKKGRGAGGIVSNFMRSLSKELLHNDDVPMTTRMAAKPAEPVAPATSSRSVPRASISTVEARLREADGQRRPPPKNSSGEAASSSIPPLTSAPKPLAKRRQSVRTMLV